jgi:hypothetical protein
MLLRIAEEINDEAIYAPARGLKLRDKYLKLRDKYTGQYVLAPYIWIDLGRREFQSKLTNSAEHKKLIAESLKEVNGLGYYRVEDSEWWNGFWGAEPKSVRAVPVGGAKEVDIASRYYRELPKPETWDKERARHDHRGRHYKRGGTAGRKLPGTMAEIKQRLPGLNYRQHVVFQGMMLDEPPRTRADLARELGIRHLNQVSEILKQAQTKMNKWLLGK